MCKIKKYLFCLFLFLIINNRSISKNNIKQDFSKPIKIEADEVSLKKNTDFILFKGNVRIKQSDLNMYTDRVYVYYKKIDKKEIEKINAVGNVILKNKDIVASGENAIYDLKENTILLENNVILTEKDITVYGDKMIYNTITKETKINGDKKEKRITIILDNINDLKDRYDNE